MCRCVLGGCKRLWRQPCSAALVAKLAVSSLAMAVVDVVPVVAVAAATAAAAVKAAVFNSIGG